jgi:NAD(P)-dependent dehydrogenase (short-subunit alcohol dehydrogenase family)
MSTDDTAPPPLFDLSGTVAVVTGSGRGLGRAMAEALASAGATVVLCGRSAKTLAAATDAIIAAGGQAWWKLADVSREDDVRALLGAVRDRHGAVDTLVNNAGINPTYKASESLDLGEWQRIIDINLTGVFLCCRHFGAAMLERGSGSIINVSSVAGHVGMRKTLPYNASKGGVELITRTLAVEWAPRVRVNGIAPGYFETELTEGMRAHPVLSERALANTPLGRFGLPPEIAGAVIFLASSASAYVTGHSRPARIAASMRSSPSRAVCSSCSGSSLAVLTCRSTAGPCTTLQSSSATRAGCTSAGKMPASMHRRTRRCASSRVAPPSVEPAASAGADGSTHNSRKYSGRVLLNSKYRQKKRRRSSSGSSVHGPTLSR